MSGTVGPIAASTDQQQFAGRLMAQAHPEGVDLVGPDGLLAGVTRQVLATACEAGRSAHVGDDRHDPAGCQGGTCRTGTCSTTVLTEVGPGQSEVLRDWDGSVKPTIVAKRPRRRDGIDAVVRSRTGRGLTTGRLVSRVRYRASPASRTVSRRPGSRRVKVAPRPGPGESACRSPPCARASPRAMVRPTPDPAERRCRFGER